MGAGLRRPGRRASWIAALVLVAAVVTPVEAADPGTAADPKVRQLLDLLADPDVRSFLATRSEHAETPAPPPAAEHTMSASLGDQLQGLRNHLTALSRSVDDFPSQARMAQSMALGAVEQRGLASTGFALAAFVVLGFGAQWLFAIAGRPFRRWLLALRLDTVEERLKAVFARLLYGLGVLVCYALGSIGAFLLFDWPVLIKTLLLGFLIAFLNVRLCTIVGRFLLAPGAVRFRVVPISTAAAWFLYRRLFAAAAVASFGWQSIVLLARFGFSPLGQELSTDALGLVLLLLALETVWRCPPLDGMADESRPRPVAQRSVAIILTLAAGALWALWVGQALQPFWLLAFAMGLPLTIATARASVVHILRPIDHDIALDEARSFQAIIFERGVRATIIISAALLLARVFDVDVVSLTMQDTLGTRVIRAVISVAVIGLAADFLWTIIRAVIDRKLAQTRPLAAGTDHDLGHAARLQTLLPIVSNFILAAIVILAAMMMLSALGVQIGPLIASAGVVGVAIGFGAQTLVRDIISGIFYLVDDAFRIGEYIQSGNYKGTVESFSLRSVKLRHQRGALYTVPFGVLGAVQNQSRDWVVDKIVMNVPYDTDLDKVRKLIKKIGIAISEDPEFGPDVIAPLKMQGVSQFGDFAIQIQTKMMTKPGDVQFAARRRALLLIKLAFEENGIGFAMPTVQVSGDRPGSNAAAALSLGLDQPIKAAE